jgi:catalase
VSVDFSLLTTASVQYDAVYIPDGKAAVAALKADGRALHFVEEAYKHYKTIAATGTGRDLITAALSVPRVLTQPGVVVGQNVASVGAAFVAGIKTDRHWTRQDTNQVSA